MFQAFQTLADSKFTLIKPNFVTNKWDGHLRLASQFRPFIQSLLNTAGLSYIVLDVVASPRLIRPNEDYRIVANDTRIKMHKRKNSRKHMQNGQPKWPQSMLPDSMLNSISVSTPLHPTCLTKEQFPFNCPSLLPTSSNGCEHNTELRRSLHRRSWSRITGEHSIYRFTVSKSNNYDEYFEIILCFSFLTLRSLCHTNYVTFDHLILATPSLLLPLHLWPLLNFCLSYSPAPMYYAPIL